MLTAVSTSDSAIHPRTLIADLDLHLAKENGVYRMIVDHPDWVVPAGRRLWLELTFRDAVTLGPEAGVVLLEGDTKAVTEAYFDGLMEAMLGTYSALSEPRPWGAAPPDMCHTNYRELTRCAVKHEITCSPAAGTAPVSQECLGRRLVFTAVQGQDVGRP